VTLTNDKDKGFSLIELLIVVAVIVLLTTGGVKTYQQNLTRVGLKQAQSDLMALAAKMEEFRIQSSTYVGAAGSKESPEKTGTPWIFSNQSPSFVSADKRNYDLYITLADEFAYELKAEPISKRFQALSYSSKGVKRWDKNSDGEFSQDETCWQC